MHIINNAYISDQGKIMTFDGIIKEYVDGSMYPNNYIPIHLKMDITKVKWMCDSFTQNCLL